MPSLNANQLNTLVQMGTILRFLRKRGDLVATWLYSPPQQSLHAILSSYGLVVRIDGDGDAQLYQAIPCLAGTSLYAPCPPGLREAASWLCGRGWGSMK